MVRFCICLFSLPLSSVLASQSVDKSTKTGSVDVSPVMEMKLVPPASAFPEVQSEISILEHDRERAEMDLQHHLHEAYEAAVIDAQSAISNAVARVLGAGNVVASSASLAKTHEGSTERLAKTCEALSAKTGRGGVAFLQKSVLDTDAAGEEDDAFAVRVTLLAPAAPDPSLQDGIEHIEVKRSALERQLFEQACSEMGALTALVLRELSNGLKEYTSGGGQPLAFLQRRAHAARSGLPAQANVRLSASDKPFPRIKDLIQDMELRRDAVEQQERRQILDLEMSLLKAEHEMIQEAIHNARQN